MKLIKPNLPGQTNTLNLAHAAVGAYSPEKWLYNKIYCPSNRSKQIKETHTAYGAGTQYTRQSLNEKQHTWLHRQTVIDCEAMYAVLHSNFAAFIVRQRYKPCGFPGFVWTDCWGNKSCYVITSPANIALRPSCTGITRSTSRPECITTGIQRVQILRCPQINM